MEHHDKLLVEEVSKSKKMETHKNDNFKQVQEYMKQKSVHNCRMAFRIRCELVKDIKGNFKSKYKRQGGEKALKFEDCSLDQVQFQSLCMECPHWAGIREGLDLNTLEGLVNFFQRLLKERLMELHIETPVRDSETG